MLILFFKRHRLCLQAFACLCCWPVFFTEVLAEGIVDKKVSVIFPEIRSAYAKVFNDINDGIKEGFQGAVNEIVVSKRTDVNFLKKKIKKQQPDVLVALGGSSLRTLKSLQPEIPILAGAVIKNGGSIAGISMIPDGSTLMEILLALKPGIKTIYVVSGKRTPPGLVESAQKFLQKRDVKLFSFQANSLQEGAESYKNIFSDVDTGDVVWILPGAPQLDGSVFSLLLEEAWKKHLVVFSSNPSHVSRGILFSVYPDNIGMGRSLGVMASNAANGKLPNGGLVSVQDLFVGVNKRTAKHLGVNLQSVNLGEAKTLVMTQ